MVTLEWFNGKEWTVVSQWANEMIAWISLGDDNCNYRTVDEEGNVLTDRSNK